MRSKEARFYKKWDRALFQVYCKPREAIFCSVRPELLSDNILRHLRRTGTERLFEELEDDRLLAMVGGMLVESAFDDLLSAIMPGFSELSKRRDITHSIKIDFTRAFRLVPPSLLDRVDLVRRVRNAFAHQLKIDKFKSLPNKTLLPFRRFEGGINPQRLPRSRFGKDRIIFQEIVGITCQQLYLFRLHTQILNRQVRSKKFLVSLERDFKKRTKATFDSANHTQKLVKASKTPDGRTDWQKVLKKMFESYEKHLVAQKRWNPPAK